nr:immunoglobulin heavy chain junction region [Mus musculus]
YCARLYYGSNYD